MKRTAAYIGTFNHHHPAGIAHIQALRDKLRVEHGDTKYLKLQGRLGKNRSLDITEKYREKSHGWTTNYCVELADAAYVDAYVYDRPPRHLSREFPRMYVFAGTRRIYNDDPELVVTGIEEGPMGEDILHFTYPVESKGVTRRLSFTSRVICQR